MYWIVLLGLLILTPLSAYGLTPWHPSLLWHAGAMFCVSIWVFYTDKWLGALGAYIILSTLAAPSSETLTMAMYVVGGIGFLRLVKRLTVDQRRYVRLGLTIIAMVQVILIIVQTFGYDPLWLGGSKMPEGALVHGTLGNPGPAGWFLAIAGTIVPPLFIVPVIVGVVLTKSAIALLALVVGLLLRFAHSWTTYALVIGLAVVGLLVRGFDFTSWWYRLAVWEAAVSLWTSKGLLFGLGWQNYLVLASNGQINEIWVQAHNEFLQFGFTYGLVGLLLAICWLYRQKFSATLGCVLMLCLAGFPFHHYGTSILSLVGLGWREDKLR